MRGDSLRDFYAKTLALVGLGVLAGVGALFDYWPAGIRLVPAAPALELPELAKSFSAPLAPVVEAKAARASLRRAEPGSVVVVDLPTAVVEVPVTPEPAAATIPEPLVAAVELPAPAVVLASLAPTEVLPEPVATTTLVATSDVPTDYTPGLGWREPAALVDTSDNDDGGFISDALRKTGTSLVRTGARTGASIVDAVRVVSGAVRRALPN